MTDEERESRVRTTTLSCVVGGVIAGGVLAAMLVIAQAETAKAMLFAASASEPFELKSASANEQLRGDGVSEPGAKQSKGPFFAALALMPAQTNLPNRAAPEAAIKDVPRLPSPPPDIGPGASASVRPIPTVVSPFPVPSVSARPLLLGASSSAGVPSSRSSASATQGTLGPLAVASEATPLGAAPLAVVSSASAPLSAAATAPLNQQEVAVPWLLPAVPSGSQEYPTPQATLPGPPPAPLPSGSNNTAPVTAELSSQMN